MLGVIVFMLPNSVLYLMDMDFEGTIRRCEQAAGTVRVQGASLVVGTCRRMEVRLLDCPPQSWLEKE